MVQAGAMSVEQYLATSFEDADRDFVDGETLERNLGEWLLAIFRQESKRLGIQARPEIRISIKPGRFRVADVAVWRLSDDVGQRVPEVSPVLVVEILSPEDRAVRMVPRVHDYLDAGVQSVWIVDPYEGGALLYSQSDPTGQAVTVLTTGDPALSFPLTTILNPQ